LPLRANLSALENIAIVRQYVHNAPFAKAADEAWQLLERIGATDCALARDPALSDEQRFLAKLLRAVMTDPPLLVIDRPGQMLPDTDYPAFLDGTLNALEDHFEHCWIVDYAWNEPLYARR